MTFFSNHTENTTKSNKDDLSKITILVLNALKNIITHKDIQIDVLQNEILNENTLYIEDLKGMIENYLSQSLFMNNIGMILSSYINKEYNSERLFYIKKLIKIFYSVPLTKLKYIFNIIKNMIKLNMDMDDNNENINFHEKNDKDVSIERQRSYERIYLDENIFPVLQRQASSQLNPQSQTQTTQIQSEKLKQSTKFSEQVNKDMIYKDYKEYKYMKDDKDIKVLKERRDSEINIEMIRNNLYLSKKHMGKNLSNQETDNTSINNLSGEGKYVKSKKFSLNSIQYDKGLGISQVNLLDKVDFSLSKQSNLNDEYNFNKNHKNSNKLSLDLKLNMVEIDENQNFIEEEKIPQNDSKKNVHKPQIDRFLFDPLTIDQHKNKNEKIKFDFTSN